MKSHEYSIVLAAWLRLPVKAVGDALNACRRAGLLSTPGKPLSPVHAAEGLLAVMVASLGTESGLSHRIARACAMSLEAPRGQDPLDGMPREPFCRMVGKTAGALSANGYLTLAETVGTAFERHEENLGTIDLVKLSFRIHGTSVVACFEVTHGGSPCEWTFTADGSLAPRAGLYREVSVATSVLSGIAYLLSAESALG